MLTKHKPFTSFCFLMLFIPLCVAQNGIGARFAAMANNFTAVQGAWNTNGNCAGITDVKSPTVAASYTKYFYGSELSNQAAIAVLPFNRAAFGLGFQRYGISVYNEIKGTAAIAKSFGNQLSIGLKGNYHQVKITHYGADQKFSMDVGLQFAFTPQIRAGLFLENPMRLNYRNHVNFPVQSAYQIGLGYQANHKLLLVSGVRRETDQLTTVSGGLEYQLIEVLCFRGGISANPFRHFGGCGLAVKKWIVDLSIENQQNLGYTPQMALTYAF